MDGLTDMSTHFIWSFQRNDLKTNANCFGYKGNRIETKLFGLECPSYARFTVARNIPEAKTEESFGMIGRKLDVHQNVELTKYRHWYWEKIPVFFVERSR